MCLFVPFPACRVCNRQEANHHSRANDNKKAYGRYQVAKKETTHNSQTANADQKCEKKNHTSATNNCNKKNDTNTNISYNNKTTKNENNCQDGNHSHSNHPHW